MNISYLKSTVTIEPLIFNWYAWLHLISPITAGFHFNKRYMKLLQSVLEHHELHQDASQNPHLKGGLFVKIKNDQLATISKLVKSMHDALTPLTELMEDIDYLNNKLNNYERGYALEKLYQDIPESLQGAAELLYDINDTPSIRYIEAIIYERFYDSKHQSILLSTHENPTDRPFVLSTPRIRRDEDIELRLSFDSHLIDELVVARDNGINLDAFIHKLSLDPKDIPHFKSMFTNNKPMKHSSRSYNDSGTRIRYFGHACVLLQTKNTAVLIDPLISNNTSLADCYSYSDLPDNIDAVLITHAHQDHLVLETLLQLRHRIKKIIVPRNNCGCLLDPSIKIMLHKIGFTHVEYIDEFENIVVNDVCITGIPFLGEHGDLNIYSKAAYHISTQSESFLFAADSNNLAPKLYDSVRNLLGPVDHVFIGMECKGAPYTWNYGPLSSNKVKHKHAQSRRLSGSDCERAWKLVTSLRPKNVYVYAMGLEPWLGYLLGISEENASIPIQESNEFITRCRAHAISCERLYLSKELHYTEEYIHG